MRESQRPKAPLLARYRDPSVDASKISNKQTVANASKQKDLRKKLDKQRKDRSKGLNKTKKSKGKAKESED